MHCTRVCMRFIVHRLGKVRPELTIHGTYWFFEFLHAIRLFHIGRQMSNECLVRTDQNCTYLQRYRFVSRLFVLTSTKSKTRFKSNRHIGIVLIDSLESDGGLRKEIRWVCFLTHHSPKLIRDLWQCVQGASEWKTNQQIDDLHMCGMQLFPHVDN